VIIVNIQNIVYLAIDVLMGGDDENIHKKEEKT